MKYKKIKSLLLTMTMATAMTLTGCGSVVSGSTAAESTQIETTASAAAESAGADAGSASEGTTAASQTESSSASEETAAESAGSAATSETAAEGTTTAATVSGNPATIAAIDTLDLDNQFSDKDLDDSWDASAATAITLNKTSVEVKGSGAAVEGTTVTITEAGTYVVSGELEDGQIVVAVGDQEKVKLVLNGVTITNDDSACILITSGDKLILTLAEGTENTLSDTGAAYVQTDETLNVDAVIFAKNDLSINGSGTLTVQAKTAHGIVTKDDLVITNGTINVDAADKGIVGNDSLRIGGGTINVTAADDALHTGQVEKEGKGYIYIEDGNLKLTSGDDGIHAATALIIAGGTIDVTESYEGLEGATIDILDGDIKVKASDDGINAAYSTTTSDEEVSMDFGGMENMTPPEGMENMTPPEGMENMTPPEGMENMTPPEGMENMTPPEGMENMTPPDFAGGAPGTTNTSDDGAQTSDSTSTVTSAEGGNASGQFPGGRHGGRGGYGGPGGMQNGDMQNSGMQGGTAQNSGMQGGMNGGRGGMFEAQQDVYLRISGGTIYVNADGDALDSNGTIYMEGGTVVADGPTDSGNGALDYGIAAIVSGGTISAAGSAGMAETFGTESTQYVISYTFSQALEEGTAVTLTDEAGNVVYTVTPAKTYQNVIISTPDLSAGTYTITAGSQSETFTVSEISTRAGASAGMMGGMFGGR